MKSDSVVDNSEKKKAQFLGWAYSFGLTIFKTLSILIACDSDPTSTKEKCQ